MEIKEINDKEKWDGYLVSFYDYTFLQSWNWGEINGFGREKTYRLGIFEGEKLLGMVQAFTISARRGKMLFVPHGPLFFKNDFKVYREVTDFLKKIAGDNGCVCLRISPWLLRNEENEGLYKKLGFRKAGVIMHAEDTWLVDLSGSEEEVMARMRKTTRNLIRRGVKDGVKIRQSDEIKDVDFLYDLQLEVVKRNNFVPFTKKYLQREWNQFYQDKSGILFLGEYGGEISGAALIVFMGKFAFYYQSGSREKKVPVNYVLQWEVIREAKRRGCIVYNMWGVAPEDWPNHPWRGLTIFKTGFGGELKKYLQTQDLVISPRYWLMYLVERIPKTWRNRFRI